MHSESPYAPARRLLTRGQVAESLAISLRAIDRLIADGELPSVRIGRSVRLDPQDLAEFLAARRGVDLNDHDPRASRVAEKAGVGATQGKA